MNNRFGKLVIVAWLLVFLAGCQAKQEKEKVSEVIPVKAQRVELKSLYEMVEYAGDIKAKDEAIVYPKVSGKIIEKIKQDGDEVNKGEAIAYIDRDEVGLKYEKAPVESPIKGIVGRVYVDIGQSVSEQTAVALTLNLDKVKIGLDIPEKYLPKISLGQEARISVDAYPEEKFFGVAANISPVIDLATRSAPIQISVDNPKHYLKSGMFAKVSLIIKEYKDVPVVLKEAVMGKEPNLYVFVVEKNKAILKKIILGLRQGPYYHVKEGLRQGDLVVIIGQQRLRDGALVSVEIEEEMNPAIPKNQN